MGKSSTFSEILYFLPAFFPPFSAPNHHKNAQKNNPDFGYLSELFLCFFSFVFHKAGIKSNCLSPLLQTIFPQEFLQFVFTALFLHQKTKSVACTFHFHKSLRSLTRPVILFAHPKRNQFVGRSMDKKYRKIAVTQNIQC